MPNYATAEELRLQMKKDGIFDQASDQALNVILDAAEYAINGHANRLTDGFIADTTASARIYTGSGKSVQFIDECTEITLVAVKDSATDTTYTSWTTADWVAFSGDPLNPNFNKTPYNAIMTTVTGDQDHFTSGRFSNTAGFTPILNTDRGVPTVQITAKWGYATAVPASIKQATITQAARWFKRGESAWADTAASADFGTLQFTQSLDPDVRMMIDLARLKRPSIGGI